MRCPSDINRYKPSAGSLLTLAAGKYEKRHFLSRASSTVLLLGAELLALDDQYAVANDEDGMSKRRCTALDTLLTFCPSAP
ncbi:hypothetical protein METHP14_10045 [Pseudomonas sp. P14-2025]